MSVSLRKTNKKTGKISLYLDIYKGAIMVGGKRKQIREREFLNIYLTDKPTTEIEKIKTKKCENSPKKSEQNVTLKSKQMNTASKQKTKILIF